MNRPSSEHISAFVDGELSSQEVADMLTAIGENKELAESVCEVRNLKLMVRHAYEDQMDESPQTPFWHGHLAKASAAVLILALGALGGWQLHDSTVVPHWATASNLPNDIQTVSVAVTPRPDWVILHVDNDRPDEVRSALDKASVLLRSARASGRDAHIEILANSYGLNMLRSDRAKEAARISQLAKEYPNNVKFVACGQSVARFEHEGQTVELLPHVHVAPSAIGEIVTHLKEGWTYIKV